jgi:hypothetical protein
VVVVVVLILLDKSEAALVLVELVELVYIHQ